MNNPFRNSLIQKLQCGADLIDEDRQVLEDMVADVHEVGPRQDLIQEGDRPESVYLVMEGFACRYKLLPDGNRQIMAYLVPGDLCDMHIAILGEMDHSIATLSRCKIVSIPRKMIEDLTENHGRINRALWWATLVDEATLREWLVNMGRRSADKQLAHLLCELLLRLQVVGLATENSYELPVTQTEIGDTLGITSVHCNRVFTQLRKNGLIVLKNKHITINNVAGLKEYSNFSGNYLHLTRRDRNQDRKGNGDRDATH